MQGPSILVVLLCAALAWGALAFGAVYEWAYAVLLILAGLAAIAALVRRSPGRQVSVPVSRAIALLAATVLLQLVPLPRSVVTRISPATDALLTEYDFRYAAEVSGASGAAAQAGTAVHPVSIDPRRTWLGLGFLVVYGTVLVATARALSSRDARLLVEGIIVLGVVLALVGIIQKATFNGRIYGFWQPVYLGDPFGPFVNRNHFAGWMLMGLPLALGHLWGAAARSLRTAKPGIRVRVLWLASPEGGKVVLIAFGIFLMALSLVLAGSRSGVACLAAAFLLAGWTVVRQSASVSARALAVGYLLFLAVLSAAWVGVDSLAARFASGQDLGFAGRIGAWDDARRIIGAFPAAGTGLNTYGVATLFYQTIDLDRHYVEAHNDYLQLAAEGGFLVGIPAGLLIAVFVREVRRRFREGDERTYWIRVGAVSGLVAVALQELVDFSLQMPGNSLLFVVLAAIALRSSRGAVGRGAPPFTGA